MFHHLRNLSSASLGLLEILVLGPLAAFLVVYLIPSQVGLDWNCVGAFGPQRLSGDTYVAGVMVLGTLVAFVFVSATINLFMGSASAKWAIMAPVFVPMLMLLGYSPELTQAAYRIGDSSTNVISPMMSYFALIIAFVQRYRDGAGLGTLVAMMLPYSAAFIAGWTVLLIAWILLGLPVGPDAPLYLENRG